MQVRGRWAHQRYHFRHAHGAGEAGLCKAQGSGKEDLPRQVEVLARARVRPKAMKQRPSNAGARHVTSRGSSGWQQYSTVEGARHAAELMTAIHSSSSCCVSTLRVRLGGDGVAQQ